MTFEPETLGSQSKDQILA